MLLSQSGQEIGDVEHHQYKSLRYHLRLWTLKIYMPCSNLMPSRMNTCGTRPFGTERIDKCNLLPIITGFDQVRQPQFWIWWQKLTGILFNVYWISLEAFPSLPKENKRRKHIWITENMGYTICLCRPHLHRKNHWPLVGKRQLKSCAGNLDMEAYTNLYSKTERTRKWTTLMTSRAANPGSRPYSTKMKFTK